MRFFSGALMLTVLVLFQSCALIKEPSVEVTTKSASNLNSQDQVNQLDSLSFDSSKIAKENLNKFDSITSLVVPAKPTTMIEDVKLELPKTPSNEFP